MRFGIDKIIDSNLVYTRFIDLIEKTKGHSFGSEISQIGKILNYFENYNIKIPDDMQLNFMDKFLITNFSNISDSLFIILLKHLRSLPIVNESLKVWKFNMININLRLTKMSIESFSYLLNALSENYFHTIDTYWKKTLEEIHLEDKIKMYLENPKINKE